MEEKRNSCWYCGGYGYRVEADHHKEEESLSLEDRNSCPKEQTQINHMVPCLYCNNPEEP